MSASSRKPPTKKTGRSSPAPPPPAALLARLGPGAKLAGALALAVIALGVIFLASKRNPAATKRAGGGSGYSFQVGAPGPGQPAPPIGLAGTDGSTFDLGAARGKNTLLYFQEGIGCQPCWDQIRDFERQMPKLTALGVDRVVSITNDPLDLLKRKAGDEKISTTVLSDPDLAVSRTYSANQYGMMGDSRDGHSFILVGRDGRIRWRADYGGAPDYTMFVPTAGIAADLRVGLHKAAG